MDDINLDKDAFITFCESLNVIQGLSNFWILFI